MVSIEFGGKRKEAWKIMKEIEKENVKEVKKKIEKWKNEKLHECSVVGSQVGWGYTASMIRCFERKNGDLCVVNWGYVSRVNYCPFCGYKAKMQMKLKKGVNSRVVG